MDVIEEYFVCDSCQNKDFKRICSFSLRFHRINFSDELIYDRLTHERYQCTKCQKTFTLDQIEKCMMEIKNSYKKKRA